MKHTYTLEDLEKGSIPTNAKLAVIGYPIKHSASPQMHQAALDALQIDLSYIRIEVEPGKVSEAFALMQQVGFKGCNVTIPHKLEARQHCHHLSPSVEALGATNTISFLNNEIHGDNTDGPGLVRALAEELDFSVKGSSILVLGAGGGAGKAIATQLASEACSTLYLSNRTVSKVEQLRSDLSPYSSTNCHAVDNSAEVLMSIADKVELIINATSMGMQPEDEAPFPLSSLTANHKVYDAIYNPSETPLLKAASAKGAMTANGRSMLVYQGALSFEKWLKQSPDTDLMKIAISG